MLFDDNLYNQSIMLLQQIKLVQGNTALNSTLRRHSRLKKYLLQKQIDYLQTLEDDLPA